MGMISIWRGTDSLFLVKFPKQLPWYKIFYVLSLRLFAKVCDFFVDEHYACGYQVKDNLEKFGMKKPITIFQNTLKYGKIEKKIHEKFRILYYYPIHRDSPFVRWLYGYDIYKNVKEAVTAFIPDVEFLEVHGNSDMSYYYKIVDVLLRPNRHDGSPRMVEECKLNNIDVIWTNKETGYWILAFKIITLYYKSIRQVIPFDKMKKYFN